MRNYIKNVTKLLFVSKLVLCFTISAKATGNDNIVCLKSEPIEYSGNIIESSGNTLLIEQTNSKQRVLLRINDIISLNSKNSSEITIRVENYVLDTLSCTINRIGANKIWYQDESGASETIEKSKVFGVLFDTDVYRGDLLKFQGDFIGLLNESSKEKPRIVKKSGELVPLIELTGFTSEDLEITMNYNGTVIHTKIKWEHVDKVVLKDPAKNRFIYNTGQYVYMKNGSFVRVNSNYIYKPESIAFTPDNSNIAVEQPKQDIAGLFFYDFSKESGLSLNESNQHHVAPRNNQSLKNVKIDLNFGMGYLLAPAQKDLSPTQKRYINDLRMGYTIDANLIVLINRSIGVGAKFNTFHTEDSKALIGEDNININFVGGTFYSQARLSNVGKVWSLVSIGAAIHKNEAKLFINNTNQDLNINGKTIGMYTGLGVDFDLTDFLAVGFKMGLMFGVIDEFTVSGERFEPEEPESLLRFDGQVGLIFNF